MPTRISAQVDPEGGEDVVTFEDIPDSPRDVARLMEKPDSLASWLLDDEEEEPLACEEFIVDGAPAPFYIRRLNVEKQTLVSLLSTLNKHSRVVLTETGGLTSFSAAMCFVALSDEPSGRVDLFSSLKVAYMFANSKKKRSLQVLPVLFAKILEINPGLLPDESGNSTEADPDFLGSAQTLALSK